MFFFSSFLKMRESGIMYYLEQEIQRQTSFNLEKSTEEFADFIQYLPLIYLLVSAIIFSFLVLLFEIIYSKRKKNKK